MRTCPDCKRPIGEPHRWSPGGDHLDGFEQIECKFRKACNALEEKKDWEALAKMEREYSREVKEHSDFYRKHSDSWESRCDEMEGKLTDLSNRLVEASVVTKIIGGVKYIGIPGDVTIRTSTEFGEYDRDCKTAWFRKGLDETILNGKFPKDFIRCPGCEGVKFGFERGIDWSSTNCKNRKCGKSYHDLNYGIMGHLFKDPNVIEAVNAHYNKVRRGEG